AASAPAAARPVVPARNARRFMGWVPFMSNLLVRARSLRADETSESVFVNVQWRASHVKSPRCREGKGATMNNGHMEKVGPRLRDVADAAGVSVATASKALNGRQDVSAATREKVLKASRELSFRPNRAAQQLQSGASGTVGLIANDLDGRFSIPIMMGAEDGFGIENVSVFLTDARGDLIRERHHLESHMARGVDGSILDVIR